jgi:hypothetical protein
MGLLNPIFELFFFSKKSVTISSFPSLAVDAWIEETVSSTKKIEDRKLGKKRDA